jgi:hypothetical protein
VPLQVLVQLPAQDAPHPVHSEAQLPAHKPVQLAAQPVFSCDTVASISDNALTLSSIIFISSSVTTSGSKEVSMSPVIAFNGIAFLV